MKTEHCARYAMSANVAGRACLFAASVLKSCRATDVADALAVVLEDEHVLLVL